MRLKKVLTSLAMAVLATVPFAGSAQTPTVGLLELTGSPAEKPGPLDWLLAGGGPATLQDMIDTLDKAGRDGSLKGVVVRLKDPTLDLAQVEEIGDAMERIRAKGKNVHLFAESFGNAEMMLAAHADEVIMQSGGAFSLPGIATEEMYFADMFRWIGVEPDFVQVGKFKGASEPYAREKPSPEWDQNINSLLDGLYANLRTTIGAARGFDEAGLDAAMTQAWWADGTQAKELGFVDAVVDLPDLAMHLSTRYGGTPEWRTLGGSGESSLEFNPANPFAMLAMLTRTPDRHPDRETIAVVHIDGPIVDGESSDGGLFGGGSSVGSRTIRNALADLEDEDLIKGVILRIDSPGGSAIASEIIWQGVQRIAAKKPVWVSVGGMAASGGYYIAVSGSKIYVNPSSIVGSIGVVGGKLALQGVYDKIRLRTVMRTRGPMAGMLSATQPWTAEQRELIRRKMTETYDLFTSRVAAGRVGIDLTSTAEGRLFVGQAAIDMKMADQIGSLTQCVRDLAQSVSLEAGHYDIMHFPGPQSLTEFMEQTLGGMRLDASALTTAFGKSAAKTILAEAVGPRAWPQVRDALNAALLLREEPVILAAPRTILIR